MGKGFFHRYFQDYTEQQLPGNDGRLHTIRTYRGFLYAPVLTDAGWALRAAGYSALYAGGAALTIFGASRPAACNTAPYAALALGLSLVSMLILLIPLVTCAFGKREQTIYQYRSGHNTCVLWARITAGVLALLTVLALIAALLAGENPGVPVICFALASAAEAMIGEIENRISYEKRHNPNA